MTGASMQWGQIAALIILAGFAMTLAGFVAGWAVRVSKGEAASESVRKAHERIDALEHRLAASQITAAKEYATTAAVQHMESSLKAELRAGFTELGGRIDRFLTAKD